MLITADQILFGDADELVAGWVETAAGRIVATGTGVPPRPADEQVDGVLIPGYVDVHSHGGGGASFVTEDPEAARQALAAHRRLGVTTMVAIAGHGLDTRPEAAGGLPGRPGRVGRAGRHPPRGPLARPEVQGCAPAGAARRPEPGAVSELLDAGRGTVKMVTIAPERSGAMDSIRLMVSRGVVAAIGHTDADYDTTRAAIDAGAIGATHLFNAMRSLRHREPGPVLALWEDPRVYLELIMDGVHVRPELVAFVASTEPDRVVFVTDAMAAAASTDGDYVLGELPVEVRGGVARIAGTDTIAGSTLTLDRAVRNAVAAGIPFTQAVRAATSLPADYLTLPDVGRIAVGKRADLAVLDSGLFATRVMQAGAWV